MDLRTLRKAVFLDRDGVINVFPGPGKFVLKWDEFIFMPQVQKNLQRLRARGFFLALVTNQSGVGRGLMELDTLHEIHKRMQQELDHARLDAIYYCPHHPDEGCACRKPSAFMLQQAARDHALDLTRSFLVGDSGRDIEMGRAAGCRTALCREHLPPSIEAMQERYQPERLFKTLAEAVDWILAEDAAIA
ncbi:MAG: HAD family hydrolase [Planctomycetes bacterium]|nr:HAD family hydrolase [Planctomycetota bacterium]